MTGENPDSVVLGNHYPCQQAKSPAVWDVPLPGAVVDLHRTDRHLSGLPDLSSGTPVKHTVKAHMLTINPH